MLRGKGYHRRRAAKRRCGRAARECVGVHHAHAGELFDVGVRVDAARQHELPRRIDLARAATEASADCDDGFALDRDVGLERTAGCTDRAAADHEVVGGHGCTRRLEEPAGVKLAAGVAGWQAARDVRRRLMARWRMCEHRVD